MQESTRFQLNTPHVADELIEGEVIIINLVSGNYYNLLDTGADIWQLIRNGAAFGEISRAMLARYDGDPIHVQQSIAQFVSDLEREGLVIPAQTVPDPGTEPAPSLQNATEPERRPFQPPQLNVYIDMQKMLLLDPIHEVDETGWPSPKTPPA